MGGGKVSRRAALGVLAGLSLGGIVASCAERTELTLVTFGDSILDCASYNDQGITPGQLLVRNDDGLFPEFRGEDLASRRPARLEHRARDGATVRSLAAQL